MYEIARQGERDYLAAGDRRLAGLYNAVTSGRSVTFAIQNLKNRVDGFDDWYEPVQERMRADPVCSYFRDMRNRIEKQATAGEISGSFYISDLNPAELRRYAPPGTTGMFLGDDLGRSGWTVTLPDSRQETVYFQLPPQVGEATLRIADPPDDRPLDALLAHYLDVLDGFLAEAEQQFGTTASGGPAKERGPNQRCHCQSGKKYRLCHGGRSDKPGG